MHRSLRSFRWLALIAIAIVPCVATGKPEDDKIVVDQPGPTTDKPVAPQYTSVRHITPSVTISELDNGLTVIVEEIHSAPVATVRCYVKNTGSAFEGRYLGAGLSHVLEHVVAGGTTTHRTETEARKIVESFGGATNAFTTNDRTTFFIDCPAKNTMSAIELVADSMQHIAFEPKEFARELKVVRRELADDEVDRGHVLDKLLNLTVYSKSPARHPVIGYLEVLNGTTNQTIIDFYHERYVPNNQTFVVVGDVKTQDVLDQVAKQWIGTPRGRETYVALPDEPEQLTPREAVQEMEGATYDMAIAWPTVKLSSPDLYALDLAAYILGEGDSSRLVRRLKHDRQLVLGIGASSETPDFVHGYFAVTATSPPATWQQASDAILDEVYRMRDELVDPAELATAKKQKAAELVFQRQTVQQQSDSLGQSFITAADPLFDQLYTQNIQKVTAEQIRAVARKYFVPQRLNRVIIAPPGGAPKTGAEAAASVAGEIIRSTRLANGLRVLVKQQSNLPLVNIQAFVLAGSLADDVKTAGRASLVADMLDKGTAQHTAEDISHYFDSIGGQIGMSAGRFTVFGSATCLRDDFPQAASLFAECFTRPTFPKSEFDREQSLTLGAIANRSADPQAEIGELFTDSLPATSPFHISGLGKEGTVKALTATDLASYHSKWFVAKNMIVTVFGDIKPDDAIALVEKEFGRLPAAPDFKALEFHGDNAIANSILEHKKTSKDTGMIMFGYPCESIFDGKDHAAMTVLKTILGGYSYPSGWLHNELRGAGLVYYVFVSEMTGPVPGYFTVLSQCDPDKVDEVVGRIRKNLERAKSGDIPEDEFRGAIDQIVALHAEENTTIGEQARMAALDELYGLGYDYDKQFDANIRAVTRQDVVRVAKKYLNENILVTASPAK